MAHRSERNWESVSQKNDYECQRGKHRRLCQLCESRSGRPGLPVANSPYGLWGRKATLNLNCVKVEVAVLGPTSLIVLMVSVDVKQQRTEALSGKAVPTIGK